MVFLSHLVQKTLKYYFNTDPIFLQHPPFTAYIANLSYDIDVEDVYKFFEKQNVTNIRLLRDGDPENGRLKGMKLLYFGSFILQNMYWEK